MPSKRHPVDASPDAPSFEDSLAYAREFVAEWKSHPLIVPAVAPHAPYTCTVDILRSCAELAAEFDVPLHIHLAETAFEVWKQTTPADRSAILFRIADAIEANGDELYALEAAQTGKPRNVAEVEIPVSTGDPASMFL